MTRRRRVGLALWPYIAWVLFGLLLWDGVSYLADPPVMPAALPGLAPNDPWNVLREVPGGLRLHGAVLVLFAGGLLAVIGSRRLARPQLLVLVCLIGYAAWCTYCMVGAWFAMPNPVWTSPSKWAVLTALALGLVLSPRNPGLGARA